MGRNNTNLVRFDGRTMTKAARNEMLFEAHCLIADAMFSRRLDTIWNLGVTRKLPFETVSYAVRSVHRNGWEKAYSNSMV